MDKFKQIYEKFSEEPLRPSPDTQGLYVDLSDVRGESEGLRSLAQCIRMSSTPVSLVLAGHKGSGKSTEFFRLQKQLQSTEYGGFFVVYWEADKDIDRNDVDFAELLIGIVGQLAKDIKARLGVDIKSSAFNKPMERIQSFLGSLSLKELGMEVGVGGVMAKLSATLKHSPDTRTKVREALDPDTTSWLAAANDIIGKAKLELRKNGYKDLVILVDDLDKMQIRLVEGAGCNTGENLFVHRAAQLTGFECHTVYALPLSLVYSLQASAIRASFGGVEIPVVPMIRLFAKPPEESEYPLGFEKIKEIIRLRCSAAQVAVDELFVSEVIEREIIRLSGGQPSELMSLIRSAILDGRMPIDEEAVQYLRRKGERGYARTLLREHWPILEEVRRTGYFARSEENEILFQRLIDSRAVLQYANGEEWYALNPLVAQLRPPADPSGV